jgi:hypothetical protein
LAPEPRSWWGSLRHGGLLIAPSRLAEFFPEDPKPLPDYLAERLRRDQTRLEAGVAGSEHALLTTLLVNVCELGETAPSYWKRGSDIGTAWTQRALTGEAVKPRWLWHGPYGATLPIFVDTEVARLGIGRGRRSHSRVVQWLRAAGLKVALLTNLQQWRIVHAGIDFDAWAEADTTLFFQEGRPGPQVTALQALLSPRALAPAADGEMAPLVRAIQESRRGQAELSAALGERVRLAVERLIREHAPRLERLLVAKSASPRDVYIAATRMVMRMVVALFAEARDLLPRDNPLYHGSYGLQGLRELLERAGGGSARERLRNRYGAWPRVLALFRLVHEGSHHEALPLPRYGGDLFASGAPSASDPIRRALAVFEDATGDPVPSDLAVWLVLDLLCRTLLRVRQGRGSTWVFAPVDFSDLSSEYIGILYEGLLDYELRRAPDGDPMVFLALGDEPALPLSRLEAMDDKALGDLVKKFKVKKKAAAGEEGDEEEEEDADEDEEAEEASDEPSAEGGEAAKAELVEPDDADAHHVARERAEAWARRAVAAGKLVPKPRSTKPEALRVHAQAVADAAKRLVHRVVLPGEFFLVRWGGTRKGAGTFYTRPQLAVPTVQRTLRPLAYDPPAAADGKLDEDVGAARWIPKRPEEILTLKVCDPAMGSGSFLVASLRFLTDALFASLHHHRRVRTDGDTALVTLAEGKPSEGRLVEEPLPCRPDAEDFEPRLRARLKRYVVERCLYGVDIDPLAVELARLALWIETMDRSLPFGFLDHKLKCGNSLVGCWFDRFRDYPALAWEREGGDKSHSNGVHFEKEAWTKAIKKFRTGRIKPELARWIETGTRQGSLFDRMEGATPEQLHDEALAAFEALHTLPVQETEERAALYREHIEGNVTLGRLKEVFNTWCAIWFWSADCLDVAPTPATFERPPEATRVLVREITNRYRFLHWELEFPDVFKARDAGFDAIVGNPPWEIQKPSSKEFFSNLDPLYRSYGKQEALERQTELFVHSIDDERAWLEYSAGFKAQANFGRHSASPFGDGADEAGSFNLGAGSAALHEKWRARRDTRRGYSDAEHPYRWQGSADVNTYKLFLEQSHALLRADGQLGMIAPSGVYTDQGSTELRRLFLTRCRWRWLFGFENREKVFDIHRSFKFGPVIVQKSGATEAIRSAFMRHDLSDWENAEAFAIPYAARQVDRFSPKSHALLEIRERRDLEILEKIYAHSVLLGSKDPDGWAVHCARELHMTDDSSLFARLPVLEQHGFVQDTYGRWLDKQGRRAVPLFQGIMIAPFNPVAKKWISGSGVRATWDKIPSDSEELRPQYVVDWESYLQFPKKELGWKLAYSRIRRTTDARTWMGCVLFDAPAGDSIFFIYTDPKRPHSALLLEAVLNSYVYDWQLRNRMGGTNVSWFFLEETACPEREKVARARLATLAQALNGRSIRDSHTWMALKIEGLLPPSKRWSQLRALTMHERLRIRCMIDALTASLYHLDETDLRWILRDCDHPVDLVSDKAFARKLDPKGFWRVDKDKEPELRHTVLSLIAFHDLKTSIAHRGDHDAGIAAFCAQNDGDGWMLPEMLRLADYDLGHDARAKEPQPVRARIGDRFLAWQLEQSVEESWAECERHARNLLGEEGFAKLQAELRGDYAGVPIELGQLAVERATPGAQLRLVPGEPTLFGPTMEDPPPRGPRRRRQR